MTKIQQIDNELRKGHRAETGPMRFDDDWPGIFIRGDDAFMYMNALQAFLDAKPDITVATGLPTLEPGETFSVPIENYMDRKVIEGLIKTLKQCIV